MRKKRCQVCGKRRSLNLFYKNAETKDGLLSLCTSCHKNRGDQWRKKNSEQVRKYRRWYMRRWRSKNKKQHLSYIRNYYEKNKRKIAKQQRTSRLKRAFGLSLAAYRSLYKKQKGKCAICGKRGSGKRKRLFVDHDHRTGKVRGLLCNKHNRGLGHFNDDPLLLLKAAHYLKGSR
jgi:hypothetical protein